MMPLTRRSFVVWLSSAVPLAMIVRRADALCIDALSAETAPTRNLQALAAVVLPSELGAAGTTRVVRGFQQWIAGYREHAELEHGYGTSRLRYSGPSPAPKWAAQLDALDAAARKAHGRSFAALDTAAREQLVRSALTGVRVDRMPSVADAPHVALAVIAFFYGSPEATDLCYEARIMPHACRPLAQQRNEPVKITSRRVAVERGGR